MPRRKLKTVKSVKKGTSVFDKYSDNRKKIIKRMPKQRSSFA